jgi:hypothetical protein
MNVDEIGAFLRRLHSALDDERVVVSDKASEEAASDLGWDRTDVLDELRELQVDDYLRSERSARRPSDVVHTFTPPLADGELWVRLVERDGFIVVSFHRA